MIGDLLIRIVADGLVIVVALIGGITFLRYVRRNMYQNYTRAFLAGLTSYTIARVMALFYQTVERPFVALGVAPKAAYLDNPGFPSDHALFVTTITCVVWAATRKSKASLLLAILSLIVCVGRVVALVHTWQDVVGGVIAGALGVGLWYGFYLKRYRLPI